MTQLIVAKCGKKLLKIKLASWAHDSYVGVSRLSIVTLPFNFIFRERLIESQLVERAASVAIYCIKIDEIQLIYLEGLVAALHANDIGFYVKS